MQQKTLRRPILAVAACAAGAAIALTGCSSSDDSTDAAASSALTSAVSTVTETETEASTLTTEQAQTTLRTAVNPDTPADQISGVVDTSNPATQAAIIAYAQGSSRAGYTPDIYTVKAVEVEGDKAKVTVAVASPHAPDPVDIELTYVNADGAWKLSADAVEQLAGMGRR